MSPPCFPPTVRNQVPSFPQAGSPRSGSPAARYYEDTPTSAAPFAGSWRSPSDTNAASGASLPPLADAAAKGLGLWVRCSRTAVGMGVGDDRPPRFLGNPTDGSLGSWTPVRPARQAVTACRRGPRLCQERGLPTRKVSRLDVQAFRLAVY